MSAFFDVRDLAVHIGSTAILHNINLAFNEGQVTALLGHNGSGKSTLLKTLARQIPASAGDVRLEGNAAKSLGARAFARIVGYLPQHPPGTDGLTVRELIALGRYPWRGPLGRYSDADYALIDQAIADTDLKPFEHRSVDTLSGGERQRAWIAMLLAQQTRCLLLDEPISALDVKHQVETLRLVQRLARQRELTVIVVLHDVDLASRFCDRLVALKAGQVVADGTPAEIMDSQILESIYSVPMGVMERAPGQWVSYVH
ncbi:ABC transporter ATP-binding protein [Marinobacter nauticus]|jgi:iron complex transport system ATP-binding protein|uniref:ABC transporter related protein n=1 Tax=Marinobacter nauticus (strain ATCC 700491 / DSM 11845 / VT8) TaxID=351348 RepID=A1U2P8_MARN8|nr:ATP-binding cassette domain-containing protein [Marinobacter nauticus]MAP31807.1 iron ABC transporter substrate-binding protein [Marinobacter sp.]MCG8520714.1 ATP-binding cassette domain-containing protein [Pseudomonadales bacterium]ABM19267.1 ABC transporter related protein [Marinobacter nauticus VT8]MBN8240154.1 ATP-binding cassette domain-containing protein [Marinobacter nauticus]MBY6220786.1 ATP-binding cassette domain-containing protein [Marinobacter nauticus]|tara:strand:+ start:323 stop:1096 length:774 start_codon:yes stop_codon:yes gene_type:complete